MKRLLASTSMAALFLSAMPATAQQSASSNENEFALDEIIVTAQRRDQNILDVPIAIDVLGGEKLQTRGVEDIQRLAEELPSLVVGGQSQTFGSVSISVRGMGSNIGDPAVGFYIDEIYQANSSGFVSQFIDVERIEVLKGPQGTLWGRNTTGGAVHYVTKKAVLNETTLEGFGELGWYDSLSFGDVPIKKIGAAINAPLGEKAAIRVSLSKIKQDNYTFNVDRSEPEPNQNSFNIRTSLRVEPSDDLSFVLNFSRIDDPNHNSFLFKNEVFEGSSFNFILDTIDDLEREEDPYEVRSNLDPVSDFKETGVDLKATWNIDDNWSLSSITGYKDLKQKRLVDLDSTQVTFVHNTTTQDHTWWSQELQIQYSGEKLDFIAGAYFLDEDLEQNILTTSQLSLFVLASCNSTINGNAEQIGFAAFCPFVNGTVAGAEGFGVLPIAQQLAGGGLSVEDFNQGGFWDQAVDQVNQIFAGGAPVFDPLKSSPLDSPISTAQRIYNTRSFAAFTQASYKITDRITATAGIRYTKDTKDIQSFNVTNGVLTTPFVDLSQDNVSPKFGIDWRPTEDMLLYTSVTRGFKSGTLNVSPLEDEDPEVSPETLWAYEVGMKGSWFNGQLSFDGAAFYYDYNDYQSGAQFPNGLRLFNLPDVTIKGFELAPVYRPVPQARLGFSGSYVDAKVSGDAFAPDPFNLALGSQNLDGRSLPRAPEWKMNIFADYTWAVGDEGELTASASYNYSGKFFNDIHNTFEGADYKTVNANIRYSADGGEWWVNLYARNITNEVYITSSLFTDTIGQVSFYSPPRTIGLQLGFKL